MPLHDNVTHKKAKNMGKNAAQKGQSLPSDENLISRFGPDGMPVYKEFYNKYCGTPEEQHVKKVKFAAKQCCKNKRHMPSDEKLAENYGPEYVDIYKKTYSEYSVKHDRKPDTIPRNTDDQNILNQRAKSSAKTAARKGYFLPTDKKLESKYGLEGMEYYKKHYAMYCGTPQEQRINKIKDTAQRWANNDKALPSDTELGKKYNQNEIEIYKKAFLNQREMKGVKKLRWFPQKTPAQKIRAQNPIESINHTNALYSPLPPLGPISSPFAVLEKSNHSNEQSFTPHNTSTPNAAASNYEKNTTLKRAWNQALLPPHKKRLLEIDQTTTTQLFTSQSSFYNVLNQNTDSNDLFSNTHSQININPKNTLETPSQEDTFDEHNLYSGLNTQQPNGFDQFISTNSVDIDNLLSLTDISTNHSNNLLFNYNSSHQTTLDELFENETTAINRTDTNQSDPTDLETTNIEESISSFWDFLNKKP